MTLSQLFFAAMLGFRKFSLDKKPQHVKQIRQKAETTKGRTLFAFRKPEGIHNDNSPREARTEQMTAIASQLLAATMMIEQ
jgi:hypothetical protein